MNMTFGKFFENEELRHQFHLGIDKDPRELLIYADWLEEQGEDDLAEFIRLSVAEENATTEMEKDSLYEQLVKLRKRLGDKLYNLPVNVGTFQIHRFDDHSKLTVDIVCAYVFQHSSDSIHIRFDVKKNPDSDLSSIDATVKYDCGEEQNNRAFLNFNNDSIFTFPRLTDNFDIFINIPDSENQRTYKANNRFTPHLPFSTDPTKGYGIIHLTNLHFAQLPLYY